MVTLKFCAAIRRELGYPLHDKHVEALMGARLIDREVPLPEEKRSWQSDSGSLSPEMKRKNRSATEMSFSPDRESENKLANTGKGSIYLFCNDKYGCNSKAAHGR